MSQGGIVMADFVNDIADALNTVADKVKEYGGYAKLQALIKAEEAKKQEYYYRLGKKYYELYKDAPASDLTDITDKIVAADEKIASYKEELKNAAESNEVYADVADEPAETCEACASKEEAVAEDDAEATIDADAE